MKSKLVALLALASFSFAQEEDPNLFGKLNYRHIGPVGNRIIAVVGVPGDDSIYYAGAATGGIWKSVDAGLTWNPIFDDKPVHSIGSLAVAASDPNVIWAGTGETFLRSNVSIGNGVWKSTDAGETWTHMGLDESGRIGRMIIHPTNPDIVYAAVLGHVYSPQDGRGIWRTLDGGETWEHTLFVDENTGASDLAMDPNNPRILVAATWEVSLSTWHRRSGGMGSGLHLSKDAGKTWKKLEGSALPKGPVGKVAVCMSPDDSNKIYSLMETSDGVPWEGEGTEKGELWRSDDGGKTFVVASYDRNLAGRSAYYSRCAVSPDNANEVYFLAAPYSRTLDGGTTTQAAQGFRRATFRRPVGTTTTCGSTPENGDRMIVGHDGGLSISRNRGPLVVSRSASARADVPRHRGQPGARTTSTATGRTARRFADRATAGLRRRYLGGGIPRGDVARRSAAAKAASRRPTRSTPT